MLLNDFLNVVYIILEPLASPMCLINTHLLCGLETFTTASLGWQVSTDWPALAAAAEAVAHPSVSPPPETNAPAPSPTSAAPGGAAPSPLPSVVAPGPGRPSSADTWHLHLNTNAIHFRFGESLQDVHHSVKTHNFSDRNRSDMLVLSDHMSKIHICLRSLALRLGQNWLCPDHRG